MLHAVAAPAPPTAVEHTVELFALLDPARAHTKQDELISAAWRLAPTLPICAALLRGETVPVSQLNPDWARRYGLL